jgi:hypothetical protein
VCSSDLKTALLCLAIKIDGISAQIIPKQHRQVVHSAIQHPYDIDNASRIAMYSLIASKSSFANGEYLI